MKQASTQATQASTQATKTVLVVDDEFDLASTLRAILEGEGYGVETRSNGREALDRLTAPGPKPDLVLVDVMMPLLSGCEVLKAMRQSAELKSVPVVLISSVPPAVRREEYGWQAVLHKPFSMHALLKAVQNSVGSPTVEARRRDVRE